MTDSYISGLEPEKKLQTYENTVGGNRVHSEAVTPTDQFGQPFTSGNRFPVDIGDNGLVGIYQTRVRYLLDENGEPILDEDGFPIRTEESGGDPVPFIIAGDDTALAASPSNPVSVHGAVNGTETVDAANSYDNTLAGAATFTGTATAWGTAQRLDILVNTTATGGVLYVDFYNDALNSVKRTLTLSPVGTGGRFYSFEREGGGYAVRFVNGSSSTTLYIRSSRNTLQRSIKAEPIEANLYDEIAVAPVRSVDAAKQPDGDWVNAKADGSATTTSSALGAAGVYTSAWIDSDGWRSIELFVATDQVSASNGVEIQYTDDVQAVTPIVRGSITRTFAAEDVTRGFLITRIATALDGFRIKYTNGGTPQGNFFAASTLRVDNSELPQANYGSDVTTTNPAIMTRGSLIARNDSNVYDSIRRASSGGLRVAINQSEVDLPIKALTSWQTNQANVGTSAVQIGGSPLSGRKTIAIKALASNNAKVYVGKAGVTTGSGYELNSSEGVILEIDATVTDIYAIAASGTQRVCWVEVA